MVAVASTLLGLAGGSLVGIGGPTLLGFFTIADGAQFTGGKYEGCEQ